MLQPRNMNQKWLQETLEYEARAEVYHESTCIRHGWRERLAARSAYLPPGKTRCTVRRTLPDIDFVLSNFVNSGYRNIFVLTQYMASSLIQHMNKCWNLSKLWTTHRGSPAQMRLGEHWYRGTADAVYQNLNLIRDARAAHSAVFGGDHIYRFEVSQMQVTMRNSMPT